MSLSPESCHRPLNAFEGDDGLQMECLWEQVYQCEGDGSIPGWLQRAQVTGEGCRIAGDIDDLRRADGGQALTDLRAQARPGRIDNDQVGTVDVGAIYIGAIWGRGFQEAQRIGGNASGRGARMMGSAQIVSEIGCGGR